MENMKRNELFDFIKNYLIDFDGIDDIDINENSHLSNDLKLDSIDVLDLIIEIENYFKIDIDGEEFVKLKTIGEILNFLC